VQVHDDEEAPQPPVAVVEGVQRLEGVVRHRGCHDGVDLASKTGLCPTKQVRELGAQIVPRGRRNKPCGVDGVIGGGGILASTADHLDRPHAVEATLARRAGHQEAVQLLEGCPPTRGAAARSTRRLVRRP
jgi:hypothetical protein